MGCWIDNRQPLFKDLVFKRKLGLKQARQLPDGDCQEMIPQLHQA